MLSSNSSKVRIQVKFESLNYDVYLNKLLYIPEFPNQSWLRFSKIDSQSSLTLTIMICNNCLQSYATWNSLDNWLLFSDHYISFESKINLFSWPASVTSLFFPLTFESLKTKSFSNTFPLQFSLVLKWKCLIIVNSFGHFFSLLKNTKILTRDEKKKKWSKWK